MQTKKEDFIYYKFKDLFKNLQKKQKKSDGKTDIASKTLKAPLRSFKNKKVNLNLNYSK